MAVKKKGKLGGGGRQMPANDLLYSAQQAVMQAFKGAQRTVNRRIDNVQAQAGETWDNLEKIFQARVQRALHQLGVPSAEQFAALERRVNALGAGVSRKGGAKRSSRPARRRSKSS